MLGSPANRLRLVSIVTSFATALTSAPFAFAEEATAESDSKASPHKLSAETYVDTTDQLFVNRWLKSGQYLSTREVKPGMQGYGLTVFQGNKVERFEVTVIGVVKKVLNGRDAILVRLSGPTMGKNTVIRGMSGSPVYIEGKLVGAVSYGFDFSKEPIVGITPIVDMLDALALPPSTDSPAYMPRISRAPQIEGIDLAGLSPIKTNVSGGAPKLVPLMAPVALTGFSPAAESFLGDRLKRVGLAVNSGAAGALDPGLIPARKIAQAGSSAAQAGITPGSAVSVLLTTGDFSTSATGTATTTFGGNVIAFGHPFMQAGSIDFPMATSYIHKVLPNLAVSFKVASPVKVVGSMVSDRPWSVAGQIGRSSKMIPATFSVTDKTRSVKRQFKCEVVNHPDLTSELLASTAMSAIDSTHQSSAPYVVKVHTTINTDKAGEINRNDCFSSNFAAHPASDLDKIFHVSGTSVGVFLMGTISKVLKNDYESASVKSVDLDITLEDGRKNAVIERVYVDRAQVEPGSTVKVNCVLRPYNSPRVTRTLSLKVPRAVPDGHLLVGVAPGDQIDLVRHRMGLTDPQPENLYQVVERIREQGRADSIEAVMALPQQSVIVGGQKITGPPAHWLKLFFSDRFTRGPELVKGEVRTETVEDYLLDGNHLITVEVKSPDKALAQHAPYTVTAPAAQSTNDRIFMTDQAKKTLESSRKNDTSGVAAQILSSLGQSQSAEKSTTSVTPTPWLPKKSYPHARSILAWRQSSEEDFRHGETKEVAIDSRGRLYPGFHELTKQYMPPDMQIWSGVFARDHFWFALKNKIYKWKGDASPARLVQTFPRTSIIPSLAVNSKGEIFAALVPDGTVVELTETSDRSKRPSARHVMRLDEPIVTALAFDSADNLYAGVAGSGKVYRLSRGGTDPTCVFDCGQAHVTSLIHSKIDGRMYVGTAEKGAVYSFDQSGGVRAEYQSTDHIVTGAIRDSKGNLYVTSAGQGHFIRVQPSGETDTIATSEGFYTMLYDPKTDTVLAGDAEGDITQARSEVPSNTSYFVPVSHTDEEAVMAIALDGTGKLYAATSNLASLRAFDMRPSSAASYTSTIRDAQRPARWSTFRIFGNMSLREEALLKSIKVETRTGNTSQPDLSWTHWQAAEPGTDGFAIKSPQARFLQYRLSWQSKVPERDAASASASEPFAIRRVEVTYLPANSTPYFNTISITAGSHLSGKQTLTVNGGDQDQDNLLFSAELSSDGGKTWQKLATDIRAKKPESTSKSKSRKEKDGEGEEGKSEDEADKANATPGSDKSDASPKSEKTDVSQPAQKSPPKDAKPDDKKSESKDAPAAVEKDKTMNPDDAVLKKGKRRSSKSRLDASSDKAKNGASGSKNDHQTTNSAAASALTKLIQAKLAGTKDSKDSKQSASTDSDPQEKFTYEWDTAKYKDGNYLLKLHLSDRLSNSEDFAENERIGGVVIDNTPPRIEHVSLQKDGKEGARLEVKALDAVSPITNATYRLDDGAPFALSVPVRSGDALLLDAPNMTLSSQLKALGGGSHKFQIEVQDLAGNTATKTVTLSSR